MKTTNATTKATTTTSKQTKREAQAQATTQKRLEKTSAQITSASNIDNAINQTARETMQAYLTHGANSNEFGVLLQKLASIIVHCKLNKLLESDETYREQFTEFKRDVVQYNKYFQCLDTLETLYKTQYTKDGDRKTVCIDKQRESDIYKQMEKLSFWNGADLIQDAILKLLQCLDNAKKHGATITENTLLEPFEMFDLKSKTYRNGDIKPKSLWTKHNTNAIKEASATVTRSINANKAIRESTTLYTALERTITDENGDTETITKYKRASTLSAFEITDISGKQIATVANDTDNALFESIPQRANLTTREAYILRNHYEPHYYTQKDENGKPLKDENGDTVYTFGVLSLQQIADYYKITLEAVKKCDRNMKRKIIEARIFPQFTEADKKTTQEQKAVRCYEAQDESKRTVASFDGVRSASKTLNIDASNIVKVLKGKLKTVSGLVFEYVVE